MKTAIEKIYHLNFGQIYPLYLVKIERKGRQKSELDQVITWLTGYSPKVIAKQVESATVMVDFVAHMPRLNPNAHLITGLICGVRVEEIEDPVVRCVRYMDKLVDELAKGRSLERIMRG